MEVFRIGILEKISAEPNPFQTMASCSENKERSKQQRTLDQLLPIETSAQTYR